MTVDEATNICMDYIQDGLNAIFDEWNGREVTPSFAEKVWAEIGARIERGEYVV